MGSSSSLRQKDPKILDEFLDRWHREVLWSSPDLNSLVEHDYALVDGSFSSEDQGKLRALFAGWDRYRILCLTRVLPFRARPHQRGTAPATLAERERNCSTATTTFIPGEPVMMQVNDYHRGIFNGDQGLVLNVSEGNQLQPMVIFPRSDGFAAFHIDSLQSVLLHSYAMTFTRHRARNSIGWH